MATVNEKMTAIADAIREKTGGIAPLTLDDMATDIPKVYEAGKKSQYDEFWDSFQDYGNEISYYCAFAEGGSEEYKKWNDVYNPKYDIKPTNAYNMYWQSGLADIYNGDKINVDFSKATSLQSCFYNAIKIERLKVVSAISASILQQTFDGCRKLHTIEKLILKEDGSQALVNTFRFCDALANISIEGKIGYIVNFANSPNLTYESLMGEQGIVNALKNYSGTTTTRTLTLHADAKARLSDSDIAIATQKGWTVG
ncbi:MAG: hypothetical protein J6D15_05775 [Clostridia bacterium]|nr:hypothetical protein [Clostridia bacterium]